MRGANDVGAARTFASAVGRPRVALEPEKRVNPVRGWGECGGLTPVRAGVSAAVNPEPLNLNLEPDRLEGVARVSLARAWPRVREPQTRVEPLWLAQDGHEHVRPRRHGRVEARVELRSVVGFVPAPRDDRARRRCTGGEE